MFVFLPCFLKAILRTLRRRAKNSFALNSFPLSFCLKKRVGGGGGERGAGHRVGAWHGGAGHRVPGAAPSAAGCPQPPSPLSAGLLALALTRR